MENYKPISPPQSYQGMDKPQATGPPPQRREADHSEIRNDSRPSGSVSYLPAFFTKLENTSPMVNLKKQEIFRKLNSNSGVGNSDVGNAQPGTEIFNLPAVTSSSGVNPRNHSFSDPANNMGLEDIIRKALMGNLEERPEENKGGLGAPGQGSDARQHANPSPSMGKQKHSKANSRKAKSPNLGQAYAGGKRPSSVSSIHSEGDYHRQAWAQAQRGWDDRPSSTGSMQFPYNPLTMRILSSTPPTSIASPYMQQQRHQQRQQHQQQQQQHQQHQQRQQHQQQQQQQEQKHQQQEQQHQQQQQEQQHQQHQHQHQQQQQQQLPPVGAPVAQQHVWHPLLSEQYETLSDNDDCTLLTTAQQNHYKPEERPAPGLVFSPHSPPRPEISSLTSEFDK